MGGFDLVIRNARVVTATVEMSCDVGVADGTLVALGTGLDKGAEEIDATGKLVLPGGIDSHCHIEQMSSAGLMCADDFYTGTVSAAFGGTTTIIPFAAQHRGDSLMNVVSDYHERARAKAVVDYGFHLIVSDPTQVVLRDELPELIAGGLSSFKVYMTYDRLRLTDYQMLEVLSLARREGALTMVHAENHDMIVWLTERLLASGHQAPKFHAVAHTRLAESEAASRAITLAELLDVPLLVVHVSSEQAMEAIRRAQSRGLRVYGETCPQYLFLTADDLDQEGMAGAMCCCSPPPRDEMSQEAIWRGLTSGVLQVFSSTTTTRLSGSTTRVSSPPGRIHRSTGWPTGCRGSRCGCPCCSRRGVLAGRMDLHRFVDLTATRAAKLYGLFPRKGTIAVGSDADLAIWDPELTRTIRSSEMHDNVGYTPYEGRSVTGWPVSVLSRGRVVVDQGELRAERGSGKFIPRGRPDAAKPLGQPSPESQLAARFGAEDVF